MVLGKLDLHVQKNGNGSLYYTYTHTHTKKFYWIKDLNVRHETVKLLEENIGRTLFDINCSNIFLDPSPKAKEIKTKINK